MNVISRIAAALTVGALVTACSGASATSVPQVSQSLQSTRPAAFGAQSLPAVNYFLACGDSIFAGQVRCHAAVRTDVDGAAIARAPDTTDSTGPFAGLTPKDLHRAYRLPNTGGAGRTIGIVDALDDPLAESDLAAYRAHFHLSPCTTANGCFRKLNQNGVAGKYPASSVHWTYEISLDLDMASAVCPGCRILLVEANTPTFHNLEMAVDTAVAKGASVVSNSYGAPEFASYDKHYDHKGVVIVASSGDASFAPGAEEPAGFATVVAVGGTTLTRAPGGRGWSELVWPGAGSGCSTLVKKPSWQHDTGCAGRSESDVSAVADPSTGVRIYDSLGTCCKWLVVGGTSVASPIVASIFALSGNASTQNAAQSLWNGQGHDLFDVIDGNNGTCLPAYLCTAVPGYDGPTGWGTPNGLGAF
ncbi:MAG TPA: S8 family serine peptidase [Candidatus Acidoferrales bacterium]|nr:S8 family serine peptidase [Candidatus Acidoferrales bacterium]